MTKINPRKIFSIAIVMVVLFMVASSYTRTPAPDKNFEGVKSITDEFVGTIATLNGNAITVNMDIRMSPYHGNDTSKTDTLKKVTVTKETKFFLFKKNKDFIIGNDIPLGSTTSPHRAAAPAFIETMSTFDKFEIGSKILVKVKENVWTNNNLTALEMRLLSSSPQNH
jgi:hypothetical protein